MPHCVQSRRRSPLISWQKPLFRITRISVQLSSRWSADSHGSTCFRGVSPRDEEQPFPVSPHSVLPGWAPLFTRRKRVSLLTGRPMRRASRSREHAIEWGSPRLRCGHSLLHVMAEGAPGQSIGHFSADKSGGSVGEEKADPTQLHDLYGEGQVSFADMIWALRQCPS